MINSEGWIHLIILILGVPLNQGGYGIAQVVLNYNGSPRTACPIGRNNSKPIDRYDSSITLRQLRSEMIRMTSVQDKPLDGYIVTSNDDHQSETVLAHFMRREFLTGFRGSAGEALVTGNKAILWTDGRYHIQADNQLDCNWILMKYGHEGVPSMIQWIKQEFRNNSQARIGADPKLIPAKTWTDWEEELAASSIHLVAVHKNLIDIIWQVNRTSDITHPAYELKTEFSGKSWQEKIHQVRCLMENASADALVITALDDIAWVLNIRGWDLPNTPVLRAYVVLTPQAILLYTDRKKIKRSVDLHLKTDGCYYADCVRIVNYSEIWNDLRTLSQSWSKAWLPAPCVYAQGVSRQIYVSIPSSKRYFEPSPIIALRAVKNDIEINGMRQAHIRDSIVMCDFMADMEFQMSINGKSWDEMQVVRAINGFRFEMDYNQGIAFPTIVGYGEHGAQPHYEPTERTSALIGSDSTLVIDSGGQYFDGTTDITRTFHFGEPTDEQKRAYTRVLIGSIQLASMVFPPDLRTDQLDVFAREPLWKAGSDYMHGTGHGIGHFLSVHESPISVSYVQNSTAAPGCSTHLQPGNFLSNEPGYYSKGKFGVRLENVLEVVQVGMKNSKLLKFRDATLVPYESKLIDLNMLSRSHRRWLNNYNRRIREEVGPEMLKKCKMEAYQWMEKRTRSIPEEDEVDDNYFTGDSNPSLSKKSYLLIILVIFFHTSGGVFMTYS
ncbi:xaa-Pro aminopeptidase 1 isoform X2 [Fopius arisanus]|uniref:Xaa-Pro aminopeptidase 1 isoform X2 n=1 Tax=Fopius arisanus TaxID=64838 RepID=A0A9R1U2A1_9HYME|nr:PREDICTED: xaa-Pro aminopeptidase 1 isoform X2 [Fopius arisanus]